LLTVVSTMQRSVTPRRKTATVLPHGHVRLPAGVQRQIEDIYLQLDTQLTRLAEIQLQFDQLRSKIRHL
jgi:hypothetical protein